jgi:hypothetical protein
MNIFDLTVPVKYGPNAEITVLFRTPEKEDLAWALDFKSRLREVIGDLTSEGRAKSESMIFGELPERLLSMVEGAAVQGLPALPETWKEDLSRKTYFTGDSGMATWEAVFFRNHVTPTGEPQA